MSYTKKELKGFRAMWRQEIINYVKDMFGPDVDLEYEKGGFFQILLSSMHVDFELNYYTGEVVNVFFGRNRSFGANQVWRSDYEVEAIPEITEGLVGYAQDIIAGAAFLRDIQKLHFTVLHPELPSKLKKGTELIHSELQPSYSWSFRDLNFTDRDENADHVYQDEDFW